ncbi:MAG: PAS domain-containing protein [Acidimicrobiales bacterium]
MVWNRAAQELFGLAADEVLGQAFAGLDIGLPVGELVAPVEEVIVGGRREVTVDAVDRRGRTIPCRVRISPLLLDQRAWHGAVLLLTTDAER